MDHLKIVSSQPQSGSPSASKASPATVSRAIQLLFSAYRRDDFADPDGFVTQLGVILCDFPEQVVDYVTSPRTGLQRRSKWPPTISEVVTACEEHSDFIEKQKRGRPKFQPAPVALLHSQRPQGYMAQVFVPEGHARYAKLVEWTETAAPIWWKYGKASDGRQGLWVSHDAWNGLTGLTFA